MGDKTVRQTKIIATIGPASSEQSMIHALAEAGMNIARFNFSHADYHKTAEILGSITDLQKDGYFVSTLLDTKWPEIRTGDLDAPIHYSKGEEFALVTKQEDQHGKDLYIDYPYLAQDLVQWDRIMLDSGLLPVTVVRCDEGKVIVKAQNNAIIKSRRHVNLPGVKLRLPALTEKDKKDILFGIEQGMHYIAVSFVRSGENMKEVRQFVDEHWGNTIRLIAKIENQEALDNLEDIVRLSDAVMIARGDLWIEIDIASLPSYQKLITQVCAQYGTPVIYATELLKSMVDHSFPTRAEVSDVYHAVVDAHDAIMLSDESAIGQYPVESITMLDRLARSAESNVFHVHEDYEVVMEDPYRLDKKYSARAAHYLADNLDADALIIFSQRWFFARLTAAFKSNIPVYWFTPNQSTIYYMNLLYGIHPQLMDQEYPSKRDDEKAAIKALSDTGAITTGDKVVIAYDWGDNDERMANIKIVRVP